VIKAMKNKIKEEGEELEKTRYTRDDDNKKKERVVKVKRCICSRGSISYIVHMGIEL
jgi:hypothetical protein